MDTQPKLHIKVLSSEGTLFEGDAQAITSYNPDGLFDVLPLHENFISIIEKQLIITEYPDKKKEIPMQSGVLRVIENNIEIYLGVKSIL